MKSKGLGGILLEEYEDEEGLSDPETTKQSNEEGEFSLLKAFNFANSLLGYKTLFSEQKQVMSNLSSLSELRGDSI